jgi:hypothetical protein
MEHAEILKDGIHIPHRWKVADQTELDALTPEEKEIDKLALKEDDGTYYRLNSISPVAWQKVSFTAEEIKAVTHDIAEVSGLKDALNSKQDVLSEGAFEDGDKTKLDAIEDGATKDQTPAEIKTSYESNDDTNAFTDSEKKKLLNALTSETVTSLSINANKLKYKDENGSTTEIDLSLYIDDTNLSRIVGGSVDSSTGVATFTRDDDTNFTVNMSAFLGGAGASVLQTEATLSDGASKDITCKAVLSVLKEVSGATDATHTGFTLDSEEDSTNGTDFNNGVVGLHSDDGGSTYTTTQPYYAIVSILTSTVDTIKSYNEVSDIPADTDIKRLVSYDGGTTWNKSDYQATSPLPDPIAFYTFDNVSGSTLVDEMGNYDGVISGMTQVDDGTGNMVGSFDGSNDSISISKINVSAMSVFAEIKRDSVAAMEIASSSTSNYILYISSSSLYVRNNSNSVAGAWSHSMNTTDTYKVLLVLDGTNAEIFIDGVSLGSKPLAGTYSIDTIGKGYNSHFDGTIDNFAIWDKALTQTEVAYIQTNGVQLATVAGTGALTPTTLDNLQTDGHNLLELSKMLENLDTTSIDEIQIAYDLSTTDSSKTPTINLSTSSVVVDEVGTYRSAVEGTEWTVTQPRSTGKNSKVVKNISGSSQNMLINWV